MSDTELVFERTNLRDETVIWFKIEGVPAIENKTRKLLPMSVKFTFVDGDPLSVEVNTNILKNDGSQSERYMKMPGIYMWEKSSWPEWLNEVYQLALSDFESHRKNRS